MKTNLVVSILTLAVLTACSGGGNSSSQSTTQNTESVASQKEVSQEQAFIKILALQRANEATMQAFVNENFRDVNTPEKAKAAETAAKAKIDELNSQLQTSYKNLNVTDPDVKEFFSLNENALAIQKSLDEEGNKLQALQISKKRKLTNEETKTYQDLVNKLNKVNTELLQKKIQIDSKFAKSAKDLPTKEFYQVSAASNAKYQKMAKLGAELSADKTIQSEADYRNRMYAGVVKINQEVIGQLKQIKVTDSDVANYQNQLIKVLENEIELTKKTPELEKEYKASKKLSADNQAFVENSRSITGQADEYLKVVLDKLSK